MRRDEPSERILHDQPELIPVGEAVLCLDCERISTQSGSSDCRGCGSSALLNLAAILNRPVAA